MHELLRSAICPAMMDVFRLHIQIIRLPSILVQRAYICLPEIYLCVPLSMVSCLGNFKATRKTGKWFSLSVAVFMEFVEIGRNCRCTVMGNLVSLFRDQRPQLLCRLCHQLSPATEQKNLRSTSCFLSPYFYHIHIKRYRWGSKSVFFANAEAKCHFANAR